MGSFGFALKRLSFSSLLPRGLLLAVGVGLVTGCAPSQPDFRAKLDNPAGLTRGCKVRWQDQEVGIVSRIAPQEGYFLADVRLWRQFRGQIKEGASAAVEGAPGQKPVLKIYGGTGSSRPALAGGVVIGQANMLDRMELKTTFMVWFRSSPYIRWVMIGLPIALIVLFLFFKFAKGIVKFVFTIVLLVVLAALFWVIRFEWNRHKDTIVPPDTRSRIEEFLDRTFRNAEVQQYWDTAKDEVAALWEAAKEDTGTASQQAKDALVGRLDEKIKALRDAGKTDAAREMERLRDSIVRRLDDDGESREVTPAPPE